MKKKVSKQSLVRLLWDSFRTLVRTRFGLSLPRARTPQSAHHPHKNNEEHRQCNPGGGIYVAVLLGYDNSYTTPFEIPLFGPKSFVVAVYGGWSPRG